jgi:hypothetical protein
MLLIERTEHLGQLQAQLANACASYFGELIVPPFVWQMLNIRLFHDVEQQSSIALRRWRHLIRKVMQHRSHVVRRPTR